MSEDRTYDVVLWGATGFTGSLVAEHLAERYADGDLSWAIAGRNETRLETVREELATVDERWASLDLLTGDAFDRESLDAIAAQTSVVCSTVGPYAKYGSELVAACVAAGTDYCDLSGEVHWMREMIDEHHETAREEGTRIVHACGFDSIPSDLGVLVVQEHAREQFGAPCSRIRTLVSSESFSPGNLTDAISGGTLASMSGTYAARAEDPDVKRATDHPYSLAPAGEQGGPDGGVQMGPARDDATGQWTAPFVMAAINEKVVRRSNALLDYPWGEQFRYSEASPAGSGPLGALAATGAAAGLGLFVTSMSVGPLRGLLERHVLPDPGEGPSRETIENTSFDVRLYGSGTDPDTGEAFTVTGRVTGDRDPGYGGAARMLGEAATCLARGETDTPLSGGVLTPASGIGMPLVERLREVGMTFDVEHDGAGAGP